MFPLPYAKNIRPKAEIKNNFPSPKMAEVAKVAEPRSGEVCLPFREREKCGDKGGTAVLSDPPTTQKSLNEPKPKCATKTAMKSLQRLSATFRSHPVNHSNNVRNHSTNHKDALI